MPRSAVTGAPRGRPPGPAPRTPAPAHCPGFPLPDARDCWPRRPRGRRRDRSVPRRDALGPRAAVPCWFSGIQTLLPLAQTRCDCLLHRKVTPHLTVGEPSVRAPPAAGGSSPVCGRAVPGRGAGLSWPPWPSGQALPCVRFLSLSSLRVGPETGQVLIPVSS